MLPSNRTLFGWWPTLDRDPREIERDIDDEIASHLECAARDLEAAGLSPDAAHAEARRRFGDVSAIAGACRRTQMGARIMMQRIQLVVLVALVIVVGAMAWRSHAAQAEAQAQTASLRREIARLTGTLTAQPGPPMAERALLESRYLSWLMTFQSAQDWREGARIADDLAALSPADSTAILQKIFAAIRMPEVRQQILKAFALRGGRPNALPILHLGILDSDAEVRQWARNYLRSYAWRIFASDQEALLWSTKFAIHPIEDVLEISTAEFMNRLEKSAPLDEFALLHTIDLQVLDKFGSAPVRSNVRGTLTRWIQKHGAEWDEELQQHAAREALHFALYTGQLPPAVRAYTARLREQR